MFYDQLATAIETAARSQLDDLFRQVSRALVAGTIADDQAQQLYELVQSRRGTQPGARSLAAASTPALTRRYYIRRSPEQRSPDRVASLKRRRAHAACGPLPPGLATGFTMGELAALKIVADEWLAHGVCDLSQNEIGARAGVSQAVVKRALKCAELDHSMITVQRRPRSGRKHLTNIIRIVRAEWLVWLRKGHRKAYAIKACNRAKPVFAEARGFKMDPPRAQVLRNRDSDRVDKSVKKDNRTGAGRRCRGNFRDQGEPARCGTILLLIAAFSQMRSGVQSPSL
jgi:hypothetical protein